MLPKRFEFVAPLVLAAGIYVCASGTALAQFYNSMQADAFLANTVTIPISQVNQSIANNARDEKKRLQGDSSRTKQSSAMSAQAPARTSSAAGSTGKISANNNPLPYKRDRELSEKLRAEFLRDFARQMPDAAADMRATSESNDLVQIIAGFVRLQGLDSGTMEGFLAFWYGQAWAIANQRPLPTPAQHQGIANQLRASIASSPVWANMSNRERQELFERLAYPLFVQKANYQAYLKQGKTDSMSRMAMATQEGLKKIGLDLRGLQLGDNGFTGL